METSDNSSKNSKNFFKHVFSFNEDSKADILNVIQYALLAIVPVVALNKTMQKFVPEADDEKGSLEIVAEVVIQIISTFVGLVMIDRVITYFPTYSGSEYKDFSVLYVVLAILMITLSLQTKLGEKVSILVDRLNELWEGKSDDDKNKDKPKKRKGSKEQMSNIKVSQPISPNPMMMAPPTMSMTATGGGFADGTSIHSLPTDTGSPRQQNFDAMVRNDANPMVGAARPGEGFASFNEPMPANAALGNSAFSNW